MRMAPVVMRTGCMPLWRRIGFNYTNVNTADQYHVVSVSAQGNVIPYKRRRWLSIQSVLPRLLLCNNTVGGHSHE
jgi:hypothetical protein